MTTNQKVKVAVTGAAGQIGYALLFRIASGDMFGTDTPVELSLLELEGAMEALEGVVMELHDCAFDLLKDVHITSDVNEAMQGVNWALLVGSAPRKAGMERKDLLAKNGNIFTGQGRAINDNAASDVNVFVVGNPCNTNCYIAMNNAPDVPNDRFFAMTMLDENRARAQLAMKSGEPITNVSCMNIWGNHSSTQYPDFYHAHIGDKPAVEIIDENWLQNDFITNVQKRGAEVINKRGASSAASAANAAIDSVYNLTHDTSNGEMFSVGLCSQGQYGIDQGLIFSYPCTVSNGQLRVVTDLEHNEFAKTKIDSTHEELKRERETVKELGLV